MKNFERTENRAEWESDSGEKFVSYKCKGLWDLYINGFASGKSVCPIVKEGFETLSACVAFSETV